MLDIPLEERIILALDVPSQKEAIKLIEETENHIRFYKVGLQLFLAGCWEIVDRLTSRGHKVMLDLKFFDIPETVSRAVMQLRDKGITFATIHGNDPIIRAAVKAKGNVKLLAVTVLTSFDQSDLEAMGLSGTVEQLVLKRAKKAIELGCDGVVASAREAAPLRQNITGNFIVVTPGIRPGLNMDLCKDDQKRIATARAAIRDGADYIVIGRPITQAEDPSSVIKLIQDEIKEGLNERINQ